MEQWREWLTNYLGGSDWFVLRGMRKTEDEGIWMTPGCLAWAFLSIAVSFPEKRSSGENGTFCLRGLGGIHVQTPREQSNLWICSSKDELSQGYRFGHCQHLTVVLSPGCKLEVTWWVLKCTYIRVPPQTIKYGPGHSLFFKVCLVVLMPTLNWRPRVRDIREGLEAKG